VHQPHSSHFPDCSHRQGMATPQHQQSAGSGGGVAVREAGAMPVPAMPGPRAACGAAPV